MNSEILYRRAAVLTLILNLAMVVVNWNGYRQIAELKVITARVLEQAAQSEQTNLVLASSVSVIDSH